MFYHDLHCLKLNKNWQGIDTEEIKKAINGVFSGAYLAMDIVYPELNGVYNFSECPEYKPVAWSEWAKLPIRSFDYSISSPNLTIRIPTVILSRTYSKIPMYQAKLTKKSILERDDYICQYSGKKLSKDEATVDHIIPVSKNGKNTWENQVAAAKEINNLKGVRTLEELGLTLLRKPKKPNPYPFISKINDKHRDWNHFLF